jgi:four helix bundle protein
MRILRFRALFRNNETARRGNSFAVGRDVSRDYTALRVFKQADALVLKVYLLSRRLPREETFGLQSQVRRAAVSAATNIVEGSVKRSERSWVQFLETSLGSACEVRYLLDLAVRLELIPTTELGSLCADYSDLIAGLQALISSMPAGRRTEN